MTLDDYRARCLHALISALDSWEEDDGTVHFRFDRSEQRQLLLFFRDLPDRPPVLIRVFAFLSALEADNGGL